MTVVIMLTLTAAMIGTAFLSGIFGMAGGLILIGILLIPLPVPEAMALHAITQMASNGWRGLLWLRYVRWRSASFFLIGSAVSFFCWALIQFVPSKPVAFILLGLLPLLIRLAPARIKPNPERLAHGMIYGSSCMSLMLLTGVTGPLIDQFFLSGGYDRREIVATKAACQIVSHGAKFIYFSTLIDRTSEIEMTMVILAVGASIVGTSLGAAERYAV